MTSSFLPELCLHRGDVCTLVDVKGLKRTHHILSTPPSQALGPWSSQETGEAIKEEDHAFIFSQLSSIHPKY